MGEDRRVSHTDETQGWEPDRAPTGVAVSALAEALSRPETYRELPGTAGACVEHLQTHLSHVFLVGERVVKLHKAVDLGFVDFSTREQRTADSLREVALNRRLAPDVYLGVAPLLEGPEGIRIGPVQERPEPPDAEVVVVMRRLSAGGNARARLERGALAPAQLDRIASRIAAFHDEHGLGRPAPWSAQAWRRRIEQPMRDNLGVLAEVLGDEEVRPLAARLESRLGASQGALERRRIEGRAVDGHGDLHLEHVWFEEGHREPVIIDALEFSEELRRIDAASEVAFLAMDLHYRHHHDLAERFLARYAGLRHDLDLYRVVDLYLSYRAAVRAKVAALASRDPEFDAAQRKRALQSAREHRALAERFLIPLPPGPLVVLCGTVGSGKSSVARALAAALPAVVVASDVVRKRLPGASAAPAPGVGLDRGLYTPARRAEAYRALLDEARAPLSAGRPTVLDATFASRRDRDQARLLAELQGAPAYLIEVRAGRAEVARRLARRAREGRDPSDAGPEMLDESIRRFQTPWEWPWAHRFVVRTDRPDWQRVVDELARRIAPRSPFEEEKRMSNWGERFEEEFNRLRAARDELRVQMDLASMELRDRWEKLEHRWAELEGKLKRIRESAKEDTAEVKEAAKLLAEEIREGFEHLRKQL